MIGIEELLVQLEGLEPGELLRWIEKRWVLPERRQEVYRFREVDVARAELIFEIRREFALDDETLDLVLSLLDQLYDARRALKRLCEALATQPADVRQAIATALPRARPQKRRR